MATVVKYNEMSTTQRTQVSEALTDVARNRVARLFDDHFESVYSFCLGRSADRTIAEDAAAQTFVEAARTLAADPHAQVGEPWLFVTARRRLVDGWRRQGRQVRLRERIAALPGRSTEDDSGHEADQHEAERARRALASLPERQRGAVVLRYLDEYSVAEVAELLELSYSAAESLLARGRRGFEQAWTSTGDNDG